jgi:hypothetical protein
MACISLIGNRRQSMPPAFENPHDAARLEDLEVAALLHRVLQEQIARKHRALNARLGVDLSRTRGHFGKERLKPFRYQLLRDEPLAVAPCPDRIPRSGTLGREIRRPIVVEVVASQVVVC